MKEEIIYEEISLEQAIAILPWWGGLGRVGTGRLSFSAPRGSDFLAPIQSLTHIPCYWEGGMVD